MKTMKKLATLLLAFSLMVSCFSMVAYAADGKIMFTDPQAKAGETVEIKGVVERTSGNMGKIEITMTYDKTMLKFNSGVGVTESGAGKVTYSADVSRETGRRKEFTMKFEALKAGTTKLEIASASVKDVSGNTKNYTKGSATVIIAEGEGTTATGPDATTTLDGPEDGTSTTVEVNGVSYTISNNIPTNEIPKGYVAATLDYDMTTVNVVQNETSGLMLAYLVGGNNTGKFFMYVEEDATFAPYEAIDISDNATIVVLADVSEVKLPKEYKKTTVLLNEQEFPAWQNAEEPEYCILYAISNDGEKTLYRFDTNEITYQRFTAPEILQEETDDSFIGKLSNILENHLDYVILGTGLGFLLFILIIVILSVKLYNRNAELDEIYDEYGIDTEDEDEKTVDDVVFHLDDDNDDEEDEYDDDEIEDAESAKVPSEAEFFVQQGLKEIFPEKEETSLEEVVQEKVATQPIEGGTEEVSIGKVLEQAATEKKEELYDEEEDLLENFLVDFIDLDD